MYHLLIGCILLLTNNPKINALSFTYEPQPIVTGFKREGISIQWDFKLDQEEELILFQCGFYDPKLNKMKALAQETTGSLFSPLSTVPAQFDGRVTTDPKSRTLRIKPLLFQDRGTYLCSTFIRNTVTSQLKMIASSNTTVEIEGVPEFCSKQEINHINAVEGDKASFPVTFCSNPSALVLIYWPYSSAWEEHPTKEVGLYKHHGLVVIHNITRNKCGDKMVYQGRNKHGMSTENRKITFHVKFIPSPPQNPVAIRKNQSCVEVYWERQESGNCAVKYTVLFIDKEGNAVFKTDVGPAHKIQFCGKKLWGKEEINRVNITAYTSFGARQSSAKVVPGRSQNRGMSEREDNILTILGIAAGIVGAVFLICCCCSCGGSDEDED